MLIANIFQTLQAFIVAKEPLPENLQKLVAASANSAPSAKASSKSDAKTSVSSKSETTKTVDTKAKVVVDDKDQDNKSPTKSALPFEPNSSNKKKKKGS
jgi:YidC/Oxa1 family membrane protein insertase